MPVTRAWQWGHATMGNGVGPLCQPRRAPRDVRFRHTGGGRNASRAVTAAPFPGSMPKIRLAVDKNCGSRWFFGLFRPLLAQCPWRATSLPGVSCGRVFDVGGISLEAVAKITDFRNFCPQRAGFLASSGNRGIPMRRTPWRMPPAWQSGPIPIVTLVRAPSNRRGALARTSPASLPQKCPRDR